MYQESGSIFLKKEKEKEKERKNPEYNGGVGIVVRSPAATQS